MVPGLGGGNLKVAMLSPYGPAWVGGISRFAMSLSESLRRMGIECELIANEGGVRGITTITEGPKILFCLRAAARLLRYRPHILHAHAHWHTLLPAVLYKGFHRDVKVVFTLHTPPRGARRLSAWFLSKLMARCDAITAVSEDTIRWLLHQLPHGVRVLKVYPGARTLAGGYHDSRRALTVPNRSYVAAFVGPLHWSEKVAGVKLLVHAFQEFARREPESKLFVVGGGTLLPELRSLVADLGAQAHVAAVGERDPAPYVQACDVYVHVSYMEGLPLSLLEAMLAGKPVIASRVGDIPKLLKAGEVGILIENRREAIVEALSTLCKDPALRERLGSAGRLLVERDFSWDSVASRFLALYCGR